MKIPFLIPHPIILKIFDRIVELFERSQLSFAEEEALKALLWDHGEEARLREDLRFRKTPYGRWILSKDVIANDYVFHDFVSNKRSSRQLDECLAELDEGCDWRHVFCEADPRFILADNELRLSAPFLSKEPLIEEVGELEKFKTHLPMRMLEAVAASEPAGEWGAAAQEQEADIVGWVRVDVPGLHLNDKMFIAKVKGESMNGGGKKAIGDGDFCVFELWPKGSRRDKIVLARGSFHDRDYGSYTVKMYQADDRNEDNEHEWVKLVSLNEDKEKYPDILVDPSFEEAVTIIAEHKHTLETSEFAREAKPANKKRKRDLSAAASQEKIEKGLQKSFNRLFSDEPVTSEIDAGDTVEEEEQWESRFICLDAESGGLHIELEKMPQIPPFIPKVTLTSGEFMKNQLTSNLRNKRNRVLVEVSPQNYEWQAGQKVLEELTLPGITENKVFKVNAKNYGLPLAGDLKAGNLYRVLLSPGSEVGTLEEINELNDGWKLWEFEMPAVIDADLQNALESLKLMPAKKSVPCLQWVREFPASYKELNDGSSCPIFDRATNPVAHLCGVTLEEGEAVKVFLFNGREAVTTMEFSEGDEWAFELEGLEEGNYLLKAVPSNLESETVQMPFSVVEVPFEIEAAQVSVTVRGQEYPIEQNTEVAVGDLWQLLEDDELSIKGPSLWQVTLFKGIEYQRYIDKLSFDDDGVFDVGVLKERVEHWAITDKRQNLELDFRELGKLVLKHEKVLSEEQRRQMLLEHFVSYADAARGIRDFSELRSIWLDKVLELFNGKVIDLAPEYKEECPGSVCPLLLEEEFEDGESEVARVILLVRSMNVSPIVDAYADYLCSELKVKEIVITNGFEWMRHRFRKKAHSKRVLIEEAVSSEEGFSEFMYEYGVSE